MHFNILFGIRVPNQHGFSLFVAMTTRLIKLLLCIGSLFTTSAISGQYYTYEAIELTDQPEQAINVLSKDAYNRLIMCTSNEVIAYDGLQSSLVWRCPSDEHIVDFYRLPDTAGHIVLTDHKLYSLTLLINGQDTINEIKEIDGPILIHTFIDQYLIYQDRNHSVHLIDLFNAKQQDLPYIGGRLKAINLIDDHVELYADVLYKWHHKSEKYTEHDINIPPGKIILIPHDELIYLISETGQLWSGHSNKNEQYYLDRIETPSKIISGKVIDEIIYIATEHQGFIYYNFVEKKSSRLGQYNGSCQNHIRTFYIENARHMWTTNGTDICLATNKFPVLVDRQRGVPDENITGTVNWNNDVWFSSQSSGLYTLSNNKIKHVPIIKEGNEPRITTLTSNSSRHLLIGTDGFGLLRLDQKGRFHYLDSATFFDSHISAVSTAMETELFIGTADKGLWLSIADSTSQWSSKQLFPKSLQQIVDLEALSNGDVVIATEGDITYLERAQGQLRKLFTALEGQTILDIDMWDGWVYVVLTNEVVRIPMQALGDLSEHFNESTGLQTQNNTSVHTSSEGVLISGQGQSTLYPFEFFNQPNPNSDRVLMDYEVNKNTLTQFGRESMIGTNKGLTIVDAIRHSLRHGNLLMKTIQVNEEDVSYTEGISFPARYNRWYFEFALIAPEGANNVIYNWELVGGQNEFRGQTDQRSIYFPILPSDDYVLSVEGVGDHGKTNKLNYSFVIAPEITATKWFGYLSVAGGLLGLTLLLIITSHLSSARQRRRNSQLQWQNEKLELEHKALQLQMNPHFIFNALNSIQALIGKDEKQAKYYVAKLGKMMRMTLNHSRSKWILLKDEIDLLSAYLELEKLNQPFTYSIDKTSIEDDIAIPPMMVQPIVENAVKHGVHKKQGDGNIVITFGYEGRKIKCVVQDNGPGVHATDLDASDQKTGRNNLSISTRVINERMALYEKEGVKVDPVTINENLNAEHEGTIVHIGLPYNKMKGHDE